MTAPGWPAGPVPGQGPAPGSAPDPRLAPPTPFGAPPGGPPPFARPPFGPPTPPVGRQPRRWPLVVAVVLAFAVFTSAAVLTVVVARRGPQHPAAWDPRVADIAAFVERERGLGFRQPVYVDFLPEDEFTRLVTSDPTARSEEDKKQLEREAATLRALGLIQGATDLGEDTNALRGSGVVAFYSPTTERVKVRGTELTPSVRTTLAHELTHALQDQHFDLERLQRAASSTEQESFRTLAEGDAVTAEKAYVDQMTEADRKQAEEEEKAGSQQAKAGTSSVPDVLIASFAAPYEFGPPFIAALEADGGTAKVDEAFRSPPKAEGQIIDITDYLDHRPVRSVDKPQVDGAVGDPQDLGWLTLFLMLAAHGDAHAALTAADHWAGDSATVSERDGKVCIDATIAADDAAGATALEGALQSWASSLPTESTATVRLDGDQVRLRSCDPGPTADQRIQGKPSDALILPIVRLSVFARARKDGASVSRSDCIADRFVADISVEQARSSERAEIQQRLRSAVDACPR